MPSGSVAPARERDRAMGHSSADRRGSDDSRQGHRRGPLRPEKLASARSRLGGGSIIRLLQASDVALLAGLFAYEHHGDLLVRSNLVLAAACGLVAAILVGLESYQLDPRERLAQHLYKVIGAVGGAGLLTLAFISMTFGPARTDAIVNTVDWCLLAVPILVANHLAWYGYTRFLRRRGLLTPNLLIVGATPAAQRLVALALSKRDVNILGIFDDRGKRAPEHIHGVPVLGTTADVATHRLLPFVDRIVVAVPPHATARIAELIAALAPCPNDICLLMDGEDAASEQAAHARVLNMPLSRLSDLRRGALQAALKRAVDIVFSILALIGLAPALVAISIAIRLDSPGPVLFKQRRHGYMNEEVLVWKFRSMRTEASDFTAARQVTADDDRVTKVGRFLRRTSLDELPQLWNVIRGEMSLVGPRPHAIGMLTNGAEASKLVETYAHRHRMKPGLTGWAAVNGSRGPVDTPEAVRRRVALDLEYVDRQSVWLDLWIMARTLPCVLGDSAVVR